MRLVARNARTGEESIGTGLWFQWPKGETDVDGLPRMIKAIVTNKHVVAGASHVSLVLTTAPDVNKQDSAGQPSESTALLIDISLDSPQRLVNHPGDEIDLCAILIGDQLQAIWSKGLQPFAWFPEPVDVIGGRVKASLQAIETVVMVGYPNGLWDSANNAPIARMGSTATHPLASYLGKPWFVIDVACFGGSSGSPVFLFQHGLIDEVSLGTRSALLGILWGGPVMDHEGHIEMRPIPHSARAIPIIDIPLNLGYVIHASELAPLGAAVLQRVQELEGAQPG